MKRGPTAAACCCRARRSFASACALSVCLCFAFVSASVSASPLALRNRLKESLDLFEGIINLPWFKDAPIILFLNKDDLFRRKIEAVDIGIYFPQYTGGTEYSLGLKFIQDEYFARNLNENKTIYW